MQLGTLIPQNDIGGTPAALREFAQTAEGLGYDFLEAADHVLGVNVASRPDWRRTATPRLTGSTIRSSCSASSPV